MDCQGGDEELRLLVRAELEGCCCFRADREDGSPGERVWCSCRNDDDLFPLPGAMVAHERITGHYADADASGAYTGRFYDGPHKFDLAMQQDAFAWLQTATDDGTPLAV